MSTSAIIRFKTDHETALEMAQALHWLDERTNAHGLGIACTPCLHLVAGSQYEVSAQTHWSKENAAQFIAEFRKWVRNGGWKVGRMKTEISY